MKKLFLLGCLIINTASSPADELTPFTSDGCSLFPNGNPQNKSLWLKCCIQHDMAYWMGGTKQQRLDADLALEQCVKELGEPKIASLMLTGVRAGGTPHLPSSYRWGYGWSGMRDYQALTADDMQQISDQLKWLSSLINNTLNPIQNPAATP